MILRHVLRGFAPSPAVTQDVTRLETLWALARARHGKGGPWLFGAYSLADVFYAPAAMRMAGYGLPVSSVAQAYVQLHLDDPAISAWRTLAWAEVYDPWPYPTDLTNWLWPGAHTPR